MSGDDPAAAAAQLTSEATPEGEDGGEAEGYASPSKYRNDEWAININGMLDGMDPAPPESRLGRPASKVMVGECAMATAEEWGLTEDGGVRIHPGYLLLFAVLAYLLIVTIHYVFPVADPGHGLQPGASGGSRLARLT